MSFVNFEIKARTNRPGEIRGYLMSQGAEFRGTDYQTDTYSSVRSGRLKPGCYAFQEALLVNRSKRNQASHFAAGQRFT